MGCDPVFACVCVCVCACVCARAFQRDCDPRVCVLEHMYVFRFCSLICSQCKTAGCEQLKQEKPPKTYCTVLLRVARPSLFSRTAHMLCRPFATRYHTCHTVSPTTTYAGTFQNHGYTALPDQTFKRVRPRAPRLSMWFSWFTKLSSHVDVVAVMT
jgi:hypothetical protein